MKVPPAIIRTSTLVALLILASMTYIVGLAWNEVMKQAIGPEGSKIGYALSVTGIAIVLGVLFGHFGVASKFNVV